MKGADEMTDERDEATGQPAAGGERDGSRRSDAIERILRMVSEGRVTPEEGRLLIEALSERPAVFNLADRLPQIDVESMGRLGRRLAGRMAEAQAILEREAGKVLDPDATQVRTWDGALGDREHIVLDIALTRASVEIAQIEPGLDVSPAYRIEYRPGPFSQMTSAVPDVTMDGDRLTVRQPQTLSGFMGNLNFGSVRMDRVRILLSGKLHRLDGYVRSQNGRVEIADFALGAFEIASQNGRVEVRVPKADRLDVDTNNGRVELDVPSAGTLRVQTRNGRIFFRGTARDAALSSGNGRIDAQAGSLSADGLWRLVTRNGSIDVIIPDRAIGVTTELRTRNGKAECFLEGLDMDRTRNSLTGGEWRGRREAAPGSPALTLDAEAGNGRIVLSEHPHPDENSDEAGSPDGRDA